MLQKKLKEGDKVYRLFAQSTIRARARNIHRIARIISYIARIIRSQRDNTHQCTPLQQGCARCSTNLAPLKCWNCVIFKNK